MLWANLAFLFCLSLFPFATEWVGAKHLSAFSVALYSLVSLLPGISYSMLATQVRRISPAPPRFSRAKQWVSITTYVLAIPAAFIRPALSLVMLSAVAAMWVVPPKRAALSSDARE
jgi:uncharacterized membrane protein